MEFRKSLDFRRIVVTTYFIALGIYLLVGLMPAQAVSPEAVTEIEIPAVGIFSDVTMMKYDGNKLSTPDDMVGAYTRNYNKTFLVGHSTGVFSNLSKVNVGDVITYDLIKYAVKRIEIIEKSEISMDNLLSAEEKDTIVLMTCAGTLLNNGDATHRLIIFAEAQ